MRKVFALWFWLMASIALAAPVTFSNEEQLGQWITYYYKKPDPERALEAVATASKMGFLRDGKGAPPIFGFLAGVLNRHPALAADVVRQLSGLPVRDQPVVVLGIWYSEHPDTRRLLGALKESMPEQKAMIEQFSTGSAPRLTEIPLEEGPWVLDALWGNFMATGQEAPVVRIISALPWVEVKGNIPKLMVGGAARWSLASNAVQHPRVLEICKLELKRQPKDVQILLAKVITEAEEELKGSASGSSSERTQ